MRASDTLSAPFLYTTFNKIFTMSILLQANRFLLCFAFLAALSSSFSMYAQADTQNSEADFISGLKALQQKSYKKKEVAIKNLLQVKDERVETTLKAMLNSELYYTKQDKSTVIAIKQGDSFNTTDILTQEKREDVSKYDLKRIKVNNRLRSVLRSSIAALNLSSPDSKKRLNAAKEMYKNPDKINIEAVENQLKLENNDQVKHELQTLIYLNDLSTNNKDTQLKAINQLSVNLQPEVRNQLKTLESHNDQELAQAAKRAVANIEGKVSFYEKINTAFFGLSLGSVLVLAAVGLAITFGVMGVINMAHGELIMLGAYTTYVIQQIMPNYIGLSLVVAVPAAFMVSAIAGILIERLVIRHLYGRPLETLLATFGISLILQQAVRTIFSPLNRSVETPQWMSGALEINPALFLTYNRLYIILFCLAVFALLFFIIKKTSLGLKVQAVSQNRSMARAMGIRASRVDMLTFGLGSGIAGIAGVALSQLTNVGPNLGQAYIIDSFMVVVFGGVGNLWGTLISGFTLGIANKFMEPWTGAVLAKILVLIFIILFIQQRPRGLFPQKGRSA